MLLTVARKEFVEIVRDGRFRWTAASMVLLLVTAVLAGWQRFESYTETQQAAQGATNRQWLEQGDKNPHTAAHFGNYAFKPIGPLGFLDPGITSYAGTTVFMEAHRQNFAIARPATDTSAVARFGELSGAMILQVLMPLFVVFLGFTAFAGERESGTLRQVLCTGVPRRTLLFGKAAGLAAALLLVVLPCVVVGVALVSAAGLETADAQVPARFALMTAAYLLYAGTFLFLTLAVSAWARTARTALMVLVGFWAFAAFLVPKAAAEISKQLTPSPPFGTFLAGMKEHQKRGIDGVSPFARLGRYQAELFRRHGVSRVEDLPVYWTALRMQKLEELDQPVFDQHYGAVRDAYAAQQRLQDRFGVLAPTLPLRSISMGLAGTSLVEHAKFQADAEAFRHDLVFRMNDYLSRAAADLNGVNSASNFMIADEDVFAMVPPYRYEPPSLGATIDANLGNFGVLLAWFAASVALAVLASRRMSLEVAS